jgi:hypothetical protein
MSKALSDAHQRGAARHNRRIILVERAKRSTLFMYRAV